MDISAETVAACHPDGASAALGTEDRGTAVAAMGQAFAAFCKTNADDIAGIIGIGGGGGTSIITAGMRELPYGIPKVMVSTLASGDVAPYVDISDIAMFPSVTDIAGLNRLSRAVLHNAAQALLGMVENPRAAADDDKPAIGLSMFGVTTPCVTAITETLADRYDCLVFHATGTGGRAMEKLLAERRAFWPHRHHHHRDRRPPRRRRAVRPVPARLDAVASTRRALCRFASARSTWSTSGPPTPCRPGSATVSSTITTPTSP